MIMKNDFWRNKRVLITGYEGFLGSNLTKTLINGQADITALDIETYRKDTVLTENDYKRIKVVNGSVADYNLIAELFL